MGTQREDGFFNPVLKQTITDAGSNSRKVREWFRERPQLYISLGTDTMIIMSSAVSAL